MGRVIEVVEVVEVVIEVRRGVLERGEDEELLGSEVTLWRGGDGC